jgi:hypothetical protein
MTRKNPAVSLFMITKKQTASSFRALHITAHDVTRRNTAYFILIVCAIQTPETERLLRTAGDGISYLTTRDLRDFVIPICGAISQHCENPILASWLSVRPAWKRSAATGRIFMKSEDFSKNRQENSSFVQIWQEWRVFYTKER